MTEQGVTEALDQDHTALEGLTTVNTSTAEGFTRDENLAKIEVLIQGIILFFAVFGNGFVITALGVRRKKLTRMNILIVHLTIADLFVAFFNILPQLIWDITYRFYGNEFLCKSVKYFQVVAMYASAYVLLTTAVDRYLVICHPLTIQTWSTLKVHLLVLVAWLISLVFSLPQVVIFTYREVEPNVYDCWAEFNPSWTLQLYITWITGAIYVVPALLLCLLYGNICLTVYRSLSARDIRRRNGRADYQKIENNGSTGKLSATHYCTISRSPQSQRRILSRAKVKTVKLTLTVVACYLLCWGPFFVAQMWAAWDENAPFNNQAMVIILLMASLNSCTNPWIYMAFSDNACLDAHRLDCFQPRVARQQTALLCNTEAATSRSDVSASRRDTVNGNSLHNSGIALRMLKRSSFVSLATDTSFRAEAV